MRPGSGSPRAQRGARFAHRRRRLDAVAALRGDPEEAGRIGREAADQVAVGDERAQPSPAAARPHRERRRHFDAIDRQRDVEVFGLHVLRRHRIGVRRRAEQEAGVGLDVPALVDAAEERPMRGVDIARGREGEDAAALRHQADRRDTGERGDGVAPGARGVHQHRRAVADAARVDLPATAVVTCDLDDVGVADDRAALAPDAAQVAVVEPVHVDVGGVGLEHRAENPLAAQRRHDLARAVGVEQSARAG
jgi:hypothetical protein